MEGVEILFTEQVGIMFQYNSNLLCKFMLIGFIVGIISLIFIGRADGFKYGLITSAICFLLCCIVGGIGAFISSKPTQFETRYKVTVSEEVSMVDFTEKYEIISSEGKIFYVREKILEE